MRPSTAVRAAAPGHYLVGAARPRCIGAVGCLRLRDSCVRRLWGPETLQSRGARTLRFIRCPGCGRSAGALGWGAGGANLGAAKHLGRPPWQVTRMRAEL